MRPTSVPSDRATTIVDLKTFRGRVSVSCVTPAASVTSSVWVKQRTAQEARRARLLDSLDECRVAVVRSGSAA